MIITVSCVWGWRSFMEDMDGMINRGATKENETHRCVNDTDGDGNCSRCIENPYGCFYGIPSNKESTMEVDAGQDQLSENSFRCMIIRKEDGAVLYHAFGKNYDDCKQNADILVEKFRQ